MKINVSFSGQLATRTGQAEQGLELPDGASLETALAALAGQHGEALAPLLFDADGKVTRKVLLLVVDGEQVQHPDQTVLKEGSELLLLMPMAGG